MAVRSRDYLTIGEVVERLSKTHPELTISKLRFLEEEGLVSPERTAGGYRKYTPADVQRVELILRLQKEHFLPLAVIREKLADLDRGKVPAELKGGASPSEPATLPFEMAETVRLEDAPAALGLPAPFIRELAEFGLVRIGRGPEGEELSRLDAELAHACHDLRKYGIEPRHLRMYLTFADRESALFAQVLVPAFRHRTTETRQRLLDTLGRLTEVTGELKRLLLRRALTDTFEDFS